MRRLLYLFAFIYFAEATSRPRLICDKPNEYFDCGSYCDTTCATLGEDCPVKTLVCVERCYCIPGYARDSNDDCIPIEECPQNQVCGINEEYKACPPLCPEQSCRSIFSGSLIDCVIPSGDDCKPSCRCKRGYVRSNSGVCILPEQCCPANSEIVRCPNRCPGGTCAHWEFSNCEIGCPYKGCQCKEGYVMRSARDRRCIPISWCPR